MIEPPRIWLLMGHRAGDNAQLMALVEALGWPYEIKRLAYRRFELLPNLLLGGTLAGVARRQSSRLDPPYPDLVIAGGRRNEPVARWIRKRHPGVRLIHLGRPWARLERFDLIVTTPQYRLPERPNVLHNALPLHNVTEDRLAAAAALWAPRLAHLPRPWVAVLVGGSSGPYAFTAAAGARLGRGANDLAAAAGGSLLVTTSARTPPDATAALTAAIDRPAHIFRWRKDADDNPYLGYLALADAIVVTGDSISMLTEACVTRKPVYIFDFGEGPTTMRLDPRRPRGAPGIELIRPSRRLPDLRSTGFRLFMSCAPTRWTRDIRILHHVTVGAGRAAWLGDPPPAGPPPGPLEDLERAAAAIRALFETSGRSR
jgi:mitochondrial fission protein ELM1